MKSSAGIARYIAASLLLGIALAISLPATADFRTVNRAHEVPFQNLRLPGTAVGTLSFRECSNCDLVSLRATPETVYRLNGEALELSDFSVEMQRIRSRAIAAGNIVAVLHNLDTGTVVSVSVHL